MTTYRKRLLSVSGLALLLWIAPTLAADEPAAEEPAYTPPPGLQQGWYTRIQTPMGDIVARLLPEQAPQSVAHYVGLSQGTLPWTDLVTGETVAYPYYDGMLIHTVVAGRLFETGDAGAMGRSMPLLFVPEEGFAPLNFSMPYMMGMTRMGGGRISAVKFFVTIAAQPWLNGENPCFGQVVEGREVLFNISQVKTYPSRRPIEDLFIEKIDVFAVGDPKPIPEAEHYTPRRLHIEFREKSGPDE
jgi:peptidyl-prolyl cis-trans isomerase A (cyclophilin A)